MPLGKRERRTNSGRVSSSSRERTKRCPLFGMSVESFLIDEFQTDRKSIVTLSSDPTPGRC